MTSNIQHDVGVVTGTSSGPGDSADRLPETQATGAVLGARCADRPGTSTFFHERLA